MSHFLQIMEGQYTDFVYIIFQCSFQTLHHLHVIKFIIPNFLIYDTVNLLERHAICNVIAGQCTVIRILYTAILGTQRSPSQC